MNSQNSASTVTIDLTPKKLNFNAGDQLCRVKAVVSCLNGLMTFDRSDLHLQEDELYGLALILDGVNHSLDRISDQL